MNEPTERHETGFSELLPDRHLPAAGLRDLPEPVGLRKITGASVIILATAIGSGEFLLWPYITSQVGFVFMWAALVGFGIQFFLNMEIERYTLATGESVVTGFSRLWRPWWWLFIIFALCQNFWPGWATGAATTISFVFDLGANAPIVPITIAALIAIGLALTLSPVVYQTVEKAQFVMVAFIMVFLVVIVAVASTGSAWGNFASGLASPGFPVGQAGLSAAVLLGALAFAGAGGANNLVQSNYIRDKGMGMGRHIPRIVSPVTGQEEAQPSIGYTFPVNEENLRRWRGWWRTSNWEQFITFFLVGVITLIFLAVLADSLIPAGAAKDDSIDFVLLEGQALQEKVGPWAGHFLWLAGTFALFSTNLGIIDYTSRLAADQLKINAARNSTFWTESKIYAVLVWAMIVVGSIILLSGLNQPFVLVVIASSIAGVQMFIYSALLIQLNRRTLPNELKVRGVRLAVLIFSFLFFGFLSVLLVIDQF